VHTLFLFCDSIATNQLGKHLHGGGTCLRWGTRLWALASVRDGVDEFNGDISTVTDKGILFALVIALGVKVQLAGCCSGAARVKSSRGESRTLSCRKAFTCHNRCREQSILYGRVHQIVRLGVALLRAVSYEQFILDRRATVCGLRAACQTGI